MITIPAFGQGNLPPVVLPPVAVLVLSGATTEDQKLHHKALVQHFGMGIVYDPTGTPFADALALMHAAHAKVAEEAYRGADSMWGAL